MAMRTMVPSLESECKEGVVLVKKGAVLVQAVAAATGAERFEAVALVSGVERDRGAVAMAEGLQHLLCFAATSFAVRSIHGSPAHAYLHKER